MSLFQPEDDTMHVERLIGQYAHNQHVGETMPEVTSKILMENRVEIFYELILIFLINFHFRGYS